MKAGSKFRVEVRQLQRYMTKAVARDGLTFSQPHLLPGLLADGLDASKVCGVGRLHQNAVRLDILDERPDDLRSGVKMGIVPARGGGGMQTASATQFATQPHAFLHVPVDATLTVDAAEKHADGADHVVEEATRWVVLFV
jgi:hypothetical protein